MSTCKVEFKGFNIDSSSLDNYLNQFTIDGKQKIDGAKNTISYLLSNAEDNKLGVLKLALNSNKAYIKDLANMMLNTNRKFYAEVEINNNLQGFSKYNANDNKIYINVDAISQRFSESAEEYLYERIVHDFIQGFANKELKKALTDANRDSPYMRNIINLFKEYQNITDKKQYDLFKGSIEKEPLLDPRSERSLVREGYAEGTYRAVTNLAEFLSYGLSSTQFRNTLRKQNLWQKFVSWLKDLLGLSKDNNDLEYLYENLDAYLKQDDPYTLHSGGATGADTVWGQIGKQFGISEENQMHYKTADMPNGNTQITEQDYKEGKKEAAKAANRMFGYDKPEVSMGLLIRNWSQVKYSDAVYAVGRLVPAGENAFHDNKKEDTRIAKNPTVTGGTGYAVNMAILNNKPVYVYNQYDHPTYPKGWYKYDSNINDYVPTDTPTLTRHFAGIGTRNINEDGEKAIQDAYEKTFNSKNTETKEKTIIDYMKEYHNDTDNIIFESQSFDEKIEGLIKFLIQNDIIKETKGDKGETVYEYKGKKYSKEKIADFYNVSFENSKEIYEKSKKELSPYIPYLENSDLKGLINKIVELGNLSKGEKIIANKLLEALEKHPIKLNINNGFFGLGFYRLDDDSVSINLDRILKNTEAKETFITTVLHETIHAFSMSALENNVNSRTNSDKTNSFIKNIQNLYNEYYNLVSEKERKEFSDLFNEIRKGKDTVSEEMFILKGMRDKHYGIYNLKEFITVGLTNTEFSKQLKEKNLWKRFVSYLAELLGLSDNKNDFEYLLNNYLNLVDSAYIGKEEESGSQEEAIETQENYGEEFQVDQFIFSYNPDTGKYYQHFKSKKGEVKELTNEKQQNKTFLKYIEKHPEYAEIVTYENTGNKYVYDEQRDKVISLSTGDTIVQPDIVDKVKNHEEYEHKKEVERVKRIIKSNISSLNDVDMLELLHELRNKGYNIKDEVVYFEALLEIREDEKKEIHKKEEHIKKEEIAKEEKPKKEEEPENSFSYKGITIPTKFKLSEEQEQALITLIENVTSGDTEPITLSGFAGTGKTSVIRYLEDYLKQKRGYKFLYGAPTHAATLYLGYNVDRMPFTIASSIIPQRNEITGKVEYILSGKVMSELDNFSTNIFVVDESSMIDSNTLDNFLRVTSKKGIKVIFMGDKMQLPEVTSGNRINPVTNNPIKDVSKVFTDFNLIQLSNVQRTKDNAILRVLTEIRNNPDGILPVIDDTETLKFYVAGEHNDFYRNFRKAYQEDPEETIYIAYTNEDVKKLNNSFRRALYGDDVDGLEKGETVVGYIGYGNKTLNHNDVANSIKYTITDIKYSGSEVEIELSSSQVNKLNEKHNTSGATHTRTTYLQMSEDDAFNMKELTEEDYEKNKEKIASILKKAYLIKKDALENSNWKGFSKKMKDATEDLARLEIGNNYFYNPYTDKLERTDSVNWQNPNMAALKRNYKEIFMEKSIDYGYGITIHKSQGATFKNVFFNATTTSYSNTEIHENGIQIGTEGNSLNYVGMSRASEKLHVLHSKNIKRLNNDNSIELSKNCSVF